MRKHSALFLAFSLSFAFPVIPKQQQKDDFPAYVIGDGSAVPVVNALKKKMASSRPFVVATKDDVSKIIVLISCMNREQENVPYACMYVLSFNGAAFKTFMGGGLWLAKDPDVVADNFLVAIAQDIVERFDSTNKDNLRDALKSCLMLTDTKCNVPTPLQQEFGEKQLTLGQYMIKMQE